MHKILQLVFFSCYIFYFGGYVYGQEPSVSLLGTYQLDKSSGEGFYEAFVFDGAGKVVIHSLMDYKGDFLQVGDTVVVYPDKSLFVLLKKDEQTLVGVDRWNKDLVFKKMENDTVVAPAYEQDPEYAKQFYEFYTLTGKGEVNLGAYMEIGMDPDLNASMRRLCEEGFPKACITMANTLMLTSPEMAAYFKGSTKEDEKYSPNKEIFQYYMKAIELGEMEAIAQLGAYFLLLGHKEEAQKVFEKGCELGHSGCCFSLVSLEMAEEEED